MAPRFHYVIPVMILVCLTACKRPENNSEILEMRQVDDFQKGTPISLRLHLAPEIETESVLLYANNLPADFAKEDKSYLEVSFPSLNANQYEKLIQIYGGEGSMTGRFDVSRRYVLTDFLPRFVQATTKNQFITHLYSRNDQGTLVEVDESNEPDNYIEAKLLSNCWGTVYEFLRNDPKGFYVFFAATANISEFMRDDRYSKEIPKESIQRGDALLVFSRENNQLAHASVVIDQGIYYEKPGWRGANIYRLIHEADIFAKYKSDAYTFMYRRFGEAGSLQIPNPAEYFPDHGNGFNALPQIFVPYEMNEDGTFRLSELARERSYFENAIRNQYEAN